jgi:DnaK suppressor protein
MAKADKNKKKSDKVVKPAARVAPKSTHKSSEKTPARKVVSAPKALKPVRPNLVQKKTPPVEEVKGMYTAAELGIFQTPLIKLRDQINRRIHTMADDSLKNVDDTPSEDRTDDFDREFALNLVSSEHDVLFEIDDALRRIHVKTYGKCDGCNKRIEKIRLRALPFARMCVKCQSESERGRSRFRPFGETLTQGTESATEAAEVEEAE